MLSWILGHMLRCHVVSVLVSQHQLWYALADPDYSGEKYFFDLNLLVGAPYNLVSET